MSFLHEVVPINSGSYFNVVEYATGGQETHRLGGVFGLRVALQGGRLLNTACTIGLLQFHRQLRSIGVFVVRE